MKTQKQRAAARKFVDYRMINIARAVQIAIVGGFDICLIADIDNPHAEKQLEILKTAFEGEFNQFVPMQSGALIIELGPDYDEVVPLLRGTEIDSMMAHALALKAKAEPIEDIVLSETDRQLYNSAAMRLNLPPGSLEFLKTVAAAIMKLDDMKPVDQLMAVAESIQLVSHQTWGKGYYCANTPYVHFGQHIRLPKYEADPDDIKAAIQFLTTKLDK